MPMNVLQICQKAAGGIGLDLPSAIVSGNSALAIQLRELLDDTARDVMDRHDWQALIKEANFTTVAGDVQIQDVHTNYTDFLRWLNNTTFNRSQDRRVYGSVSPHGWQGAKSQITVTPEYHFRVRGNSVLLFENTSTTDTIYFEYLSNNWLVDENRANPMNSITSDTQIPVLDDQLLALGLKWRLKRENGLEYGENFREYERRLKNLAARDVPREPLSLVPGVSRTLGIGHIPDGQFGT